jgi:hypothetical protein
MGFIFRCVSHLLQCKITSDRQTDRQSVSMIFTNSALWAEFHQLGPLGRVGLVVDMSVCVFVCVFVCVSPFHVIVPGEQSPQQSASSTSSSICNLMMKTCVAKPVGVLEQVLDELVHLQFNDEPSGI